MSGDVKGVYLSKDQWHKIRRLLDQPLGEISGQMGGTGPGIITNWLKLVTDLTTYDEDTGDPVETDGYTYIYEAVWTYYDPVEQDWRDATDGWVKVVGQNDEQLSVNWRYYCCYWGYDGDVADNSTTPEGHFALDEDGNEVAPIWMPIFPTHCQATVKCDTTGPRTVYGQLPTFYESSGCTGETDEHFVNHEDDGGGGE